MVSKKVLKNIGVFAMSAVLVAAPALAASANPGDLVARVAVHDVHGSETPAPSTPSESTETTTPSGSSESTETTTPSGSSESTETTTPSGSGASTETTTPSGSGASTESKAPVSSGVSTESTESSSSGAASTSVSLASKAVVTSSGAKLVSTVNGAYRAKSVDGVAVTAPVADVLAAFGAANIGSVKMNVADSVHGPAATASINYGLAVLAADNVAAVKGPELDLNAFLNGKKVIDINQPISIAIGVPASFRQAGYDYAVMLIQEGGRVSILPNLSADPNVISVNSKGFGVYVLVKAPAGSFDKYR